MAKWMSENVSSSESRELFQGHGNISVPVTPCTSNAVRLTVRRCAAALQAKEFTTMAIQFQVQPTAARPMKPQVSGRDAPDVNLWLAV